MILGPTSSAAFATPSVLTRDEGTENASRLIRLLVIGGTEALRRVFSRFYPPGKLKAFLDSKSSKLLKLKNRRIVTPFQWEKLFPFDSTPDSNTFDITLLILLLRNTCGLSWEAMPSPDDISLGADIARIRSMRNRLFHMGSGGVSNPYFRTQWKEISAVLERLGLKPVEIDHLRVETRGEDESCTKVLIDWYKSEMEIKDELVKMGKAIKGLKDMIRVTYLDRVPDPNQRISTSQGR